MLQGLFCTIKSLCFALHFRWWFYQTQLLCKQLLSRFPWIIFCISLNNEHLLFYYEHPFVFLLVLKHIFTFHSHKRNDIIKNSGQSMCRHMTVTGCCIDITVSSIFCYGNLSAIICLLFANKGQFCVCLILSEPVLFCPSYI